MVRSLFTSSYLSIAMRDVPAFSAMHFLMAPFSVAVRWMGCTRSMGPETFRIPRAIASTIAAEGDPAVRWFCEAMPDRGTVLSMLLAFEGEHGPAVRWFCEAMPDRGTVLSMLLAFEGEHGGTLAEEECEAAFCFAGISAANTGVARRSERMHKGKTPLKNVYGLIVFFTRS